MMLDKLSHQQKLLLLVAVVAVVCILLLSSCSQKNLEPFRDAGTAGHDNSPALIVEMPDGFSNIATKCINGTRYTVTYHGNKAYGAVSVVPSDPSCPK